MNVYRRVGAVVTCSTDWWTREESNPRLKRAAAVKSRVDTAVLDEFLLR